MNEQLVFYGSNSGIDNLYVKRKIQDVEHAFEILKQLRSCRWRIYSAWYVNPKKVSIKIPLSLAIQYEII